MKNLSPGSQRAVFAIFAGGAITYLCGQSVTATAPGDPLPGLSAAQTALFTEGRNDFQEMESVADGLGPAFNGTSCAGCHNLPAVGGSGNGNVIRAGVFANGIYADPVGGSLIHMFAIGDGKCQPQVPKNANVMTRRIPTPVFGLGLIEAISDDVLRGLAGRANPDGIRGRVALVTDPVSGIQRVGRFGWKAQQATILAFAGDAYRNEMGITNDVFPAENATGFTAEQLALCDTVADPEDKKDPVTGRRGIDRFTNFMSFLAPPPPPPGDPATQHGANVFMNVGCGTCHAPQIQTGQNANPVLDRKAVNAF